LKGNKNILPRKEKAIHEGATRKPQGIKITDRWNGLRRIEGTSAPEIKGSKQQPFLPKNSPISIQKPINPHGKNRSGGRKGKMG